MKNNAKFRLLSGFCASCLLHASAAAALYYGWNSSEGIKSVKEAPLTLSLNMFVPSPKPQEIAQIKPKQKPKPIEQKKIEPKPLIAEVPTPVTQTAAQEIEQNESVAQTQAEPAQEQIAQASSPNHDESYKLLIAAAIEKHKSYPSKARNMQLQGTVEVRLRIDTQGFLTLLEITQSSGYNILDRQTLKSVQKAAQDFPKPPKDMIFIVPVSYELI